MATIDPIGILQRQPENLNFLNTHRFRVLIHRNPTVVYFGQECNLPGLSAGNLVQSTPLLDLPVPTSKIQYEDLIITFPVDEEMQNYKEIHKWLIGINEPRSFDQYVNLSQTSEGIRSDITLAILDSDEKPVHFIQFRQAFPVSMSSLRFDSKTTDTQINMVSCTFKYDYWHFVDED